MNEYFKDINFEKFSGCTIILDIDGTLTYDKGLVVDQEAKSKLLELKKNNLVYLFSNHRVGGRNQDLARDLDIKLLESQYKKPNKKIIESLPENQKGNLVVIGDKFLVDGIFAKRIGAKFIKVKRIVHQDDEPLIKLLYLLDNIANFFLGN